MSQPPQADLVATVRQQCGEWLAEAVVLRRVELPDQASPSPVWIRSLLTVRGKLDRVEELANTALAYKGAIARAAAQAQQQAEHRWDQLADADGRTPRRGQDFEGAKERYARFNLQSFDEQHAARQYQIAAGIASDTSEQLRNCLFGLKDIRGEVLAVLSQFTSLASLETTVAPG